MELYRGGFLVTDGHHNRVLWVTRGGAISEVATLGNVVPTGLDVSRGRVFITQMGPIPHEPEDGKVLALRRRSQPIEVASGAGMLVDVERGPHGRLYALSQGQWDGVGEGSPARPNTGRLVIVRRDGSLTPVVDRHGQELVLDRPTSMEFVGNTAYVVSVDGKVYKVANL
jgi:sugar lactone lactonase YvrE